MQNNISEDQKKSIQKDSILSEIKFMQHKLLTLDLVQKLRKNGYQRESDLVKNCGSWLLFSRQQHIFTSDHRLRLKKANFCKFRFCAMCNWRRSINICRELNYACEDIQNRRNIAYLFLTLTVKNSSVEELKKSVKHLNESFVRMSKTKAFKKAVLGHFKAIELLGDKTSSGWVHPHLHCLLIVDVKYFKSRHYLSQKKWSDMWKKALRVNYIPLVDVRRIKSKKGSNLTALQSAVFEVAKYAIKSKILVDVSDSDFCHIVNQTHRMRFFSTGGILKLNLQKIQDQLIDFDKKDNEFWIEVEELLYSWCQNNYYLKEANKNAIQND